MKTAFKASCSNLGFSLLSRRYLGMSINKITGHSRHVKLLENPLDIYAHRVRTSSIISQARMVAGRILPPDGTPRNLSVSESHKRDYSILGFDSDPFGLRTNK